MDARDEDGDLLRGFLLALHAMSLTLEVGNRISAERYWEAVRGLARLLPWFTREEWQLGRAILPAPAHAGLPEPLRAAWDEQFNYDRDAARRVLLALGLPSDPTP
jgi:hypothetical protein